MNFKFLFRVGVLLVVCFGSIAIGEVAKSEENFFEFKELALPGVEFDEALVGYSGKDVIAIGGYGLDGGQRKAVGSVYVFVDGSDVWKELEALDVTIADGGVANAKDGMICVGGIVNGQASGRVAKYSLVDGKLVSELLPDLPMALVGAAAGFTADHLYVAGVSGEGAKVFLHLDMLVKNPEWEELQAWPGGVILKPAAAGLLGKFYVFGKEGFGADDPVKGYEYTKLNGWRELADSPLTDAGIVAGPCGDSHIVVFSSDTATEDVLTYHVISDKWVKLGTLPEAIVPVTFTAKGKKFSLIGADKAVMAEAVLIPTKYSWIDHGLVVVFMAGMIFIGWYLAKREKNSHDYFRAGQRIPWWAAGLSLFATGASAMSLMAMPGKSFMGDWIYFSMTIYIVFIFLPLSLFVFIPIVRRLKVATSNEYLERRFHLSIRICGSIIWAVIQILGRMSAVMLLPALALSSIAGINIVYSILIMGVVTTLYVYLGGLESVIWTDVIQAIIMVCAVGICAVWAIVSLEVDMSGAWEAISHQDKLHMFDWEIDWYGPCVLLMVSNVFVQAFGRIGDQNFIQRIQSTKSERDAKKAEITFLAVAVPLNIVLFGIGTILFLYYREHPEMIGPAVKADAVFPLFAAQNLPVGLAGIVMVAILAAAMSTLSSALNNVANIGVEDYYRRFNKNATDHGCVVVGKILTGVLGVVGTAGAIVLAKTNLSSVWDLYLTIQGLLFGAFVGFFALGVFTRRANTAGVIVGTIASAIAVHYVKTQTHLHFLIYMFVGVMTSVIVGYIASLIIPCKKKDLDGLTVYTILKRTD